jgi:uncharacterized protein (DUF4415 family)
VLPVKKMGRPTKENPNTLKISIRINAESLKKLQAYCEENKCSKGEAIRRSIDILVGEKEK